MIKIKLESQISNFFLNHFSFPTEEVLRIINSSNSENDIFPLSVINNLYNNKSIPVTVLVREKDSLLPRQRRLLLKQLVDKRLLGLWGSPLDDILDYLVIFSLSGKVLWDFRQNLNDKTRQILDLSELLLRFGTWNHQTFPGKKGIDIGNLLRNLEDPEYQIPSTRSFMSKVEFYGIKNLLSITVDWNHDDLSRGIRYSGFTKGYPESVRIDKSKTPISMELDGEDYEEESWDFTPFLSIPNLTQQVYQLVWS